MRFRNAGRVPVRAEANRRGIVPGATATPGRAGSSCRATTCRPTARWSPPTSGGAARATLLGDEFAPPHRAARIHAAAARPRTTSPSTTSQRSTATRSPSRRCRCARWSRDLAPGPGRGSRSGDAILELGRRDGGRVARAPRRSRPGAARSTDADLLPSRCSRRCCDDRGRTAPLFAPYLSLEASVGLALEPLVDARTPFGIDVRRLATARPGGRRRPPGDLGRDPRVRPDPRASTSPTPTSSRRPSRPRRCPATSTRCAAPAGCPGSPTRPTAARSARYVVGPRRPARAAAGWCRWAPPVTRARPHHLDQLEAWADGPAAAGRAGLGAAHARGGAGELSSFSNHACA